MCACRNVRIEYVPASHKKISYILPPRSILGRATGDGPFAPHDRTEIKQRLGRDLYDTALGSHRSSRSTTALLRGTIKFLRVINDISILSLDTMDAKTQ